MGWGGGGGGHGVDAPRAHPKLAAAVDAWFLGRAAHPGLGVAFAAGRRAPREELCPAFFRSFLESERVVTCGVWGLTCVRGEGC